VVDLNGSAFGSTALLSYNENEALKIIAPNAVVTDIDSADFNGGSLRVSFAANGTSTDQLAIKTDATVTLSGNTVSVDGIAIGTVSGGSNGSDLVVVFNSSATAERVTTLVEHIAYANSSENPSTGARAVTFRIIDGDGSANGGSDRDIATALIGVASANDAPVVDLNGGAPDTMVQLTYTPGNSLTKIAPAGFVSDVDSSNFSGGSLRVSFTENGTTTDRLAIITDAVVTLTNGGTTVRISGTAIGTVTGGTNGTDLVVSLNSSATSARVTTLLEHVGYANTSGSPSTLPRTVTFSLNDGDGTANGGQNIGSATATINFPVTNTAPSTADTSGSGLEDSVIAIVLSGTDTEGSVASFKIVGLPGNGSLSLNANGSGPIGLNGVVAATGNAATIYFTPTANWSGATSFQYAAIDNNGAQDATAANAAITVTPANDAPSGSVTIGGTATQGQTLTASNDLADADGLGSIGYQWQRDGVDISGATNNTYDLTEDDVGHAIRVVASYTDGHGTPESVASDATAAVGNLNDAPTGSVTIGGTATQGETLTASNDLADADGLGSISYQWQRDGVDISGATNAAYDLVEDDVGHAIRVVASYTDGHGTAESVASDATAAVGNLNDLPTGSVTIGGTATQGETLTAANMLSDADGLGTIGYQWQRDGVDISGATNNTYDLTEDDVGHAIRVVASYTDGHGTAESVASDATAAVGNLNDAPTGSVTIGGTATQGQTLTAANDLADADGLGGIGYQWQRDGVDISGATNATYDLVEDDVGHAIRVVASYTDGNGTLESVASDATAAVGNLNDAPTGSVTIGGTATQGQTLTASNTLTDADGLGSISYQWQRDGVDISGATGTTYDLTEDDVGHAISVVASYTDGHGTAESVASDATAAVGNLNDAPTGSVTISGTATQGQTLTASNDLADADGLGSISYQWQRDGVDISGATGTTYDLVEDDVGHAISVVASYTDGRGTAESVASDATAAVANLNDVPTGSVTISGTPAQGQTLTASDDLADADGLGSISYQWQRDGVDISGATGTTYDLTEDDVGHAISVVASYTDGRGTAESVASDATAAVANLNDVPTGSVTISGTATQGQTLTASNDLADADGLGSIGYQWQRDGVDISGATNSTYDLTEDDVGHAIRVLANYTDGHGTLESMASDATAAVGNLNDAPTGSVTISGTPAQGQTLTAANDLADADGLGSISYQWQRDSGAGFVDIAGATGATYLLGDGDVGALIRVVASYTDGHGAAESVASDATAAVGNVNDAPVLNSAATPSGVAVLEDPGAPVGAVGTLVSSLVDFNPPSGGLDNVTDPDAGAATGIAITLTGGNGAWYYSLDNGGTWTAFNVSSAAAARLLAADADNRLYFSPNANFNADSSITFRAWDTTTGADGGTADTTTNGGTTEFSTATDTAIFDVIPVNDAPVSSDPTVTINEDTTRTLTLSDFGTYSDVEGTPIAAVKITSLASNGSLQYDPTGTGGWVAVTLNQEISAAGVAAGRLRFVPDANENGSPYAIIGFKVGDGADFSASTYTLRVIVAAVNDPPTNLDISATSVVENVAGATVGVLSVTDPDIGDVITYTILPGADGALFTISGNELRVGGTGLDFEASPTRTVTVRATDFAGSFVERTFVVDVLDRAEVTLTSGTDIIPASVNNTQFIGNAATLNSTDNLDGGTGTDSLVLYGSGTFDLNTLAGYSDIEQVQLVNFTGSSASLYLRNGTTSAVSTNGTGSSYVYVTGTAAASSFQGGDGFDYLYLDNNSSIGSVNVGNGGSNIYFYGNNTATSIQAGTGSEYMELRGTSSVGSINLGDGGSTLYFYNTSSAGSIQAGSINGNDNIYFYSSNVASLSSVSTGAGNDYVYFSTWNPAVTIDGGTGSDQLRIDQSNATFDLTSGVTGIEQLYLYGSNATALLDADLLTSLTTINGNGGNKVSVADAAVDLTGKSVSTLTVHSTNATGTTFTVNSKTTALQIFGGAGSDVVNAPSLTFTAAERDAIFATTSIESIVDLTGTYTAPAADPNVVKLTPGTDNVSLGAGSQTINANAVTLNSSDNLAAGADTDTLALFGSGTFDLNTLAGYSDIEQVQLVNFTGSSASLYLRNGTTSAVSTNGTGSSYVYVTGTAAASSFQGGDGFDYLYLDNNSSIGSVNVGNGGSNIYFYGNNTATSIQAGTGSEYMELRGTSSVGSINLGDGGSTLYFYNTSSAGSIQAGSINGNDNIYFYSSNVASLSSVSTGAGNDYVYFSTWNPAVTIDGGTGSDQLRIDQSNATFDLTSGVTGIEQLYLYGSNATALLDADLLTSLTTINGNGGNKVSVADAAVDLTGKSVSTLTVHSTNATGTTFIVNDSSTAFQVFGGPGSDTIQTSSFAFNATQRDAIFAGSSIELIRDTSGFYGDETDNTITGTASADTIQGGGGNDTITGAGGADSLAGGAGADHFVFNFPSEGTDTISDFVSGTDKLEISASGFGGGLTAGMDPATVFGSSADATFGSATERFHFDTTTDTLYFDADGTAGGSAPVALTQFQNNVNILASDLHLF
jgi:hypothetical protein